MTELEDSQQPCVMCHQPNEQMLMLSCVHDPCVNCAAIHYVENQPHNSLNYTCAKCGQGTQLDHSSVGELQRVYNLQKNKRKNRTQLSTASQKEKPEIKSYYNDSYQYRQPKQYPKPSTNDKYNKSRGKEYVQAPNSKYSQPPPRQKEYAQAPNGKYSQPPPRQKEYAQAPTSKYSQPSPVSQPSYTNAPPKKAGYQLTYPCNDHQDEQLTYFCFTCNRPICPECAIHGHHKDHQVETTRKAIKQIKQLLLQDKQKLDAEINTLATNRDSSKKLTKEWVDENKRDQDYIKKKLNQLKAVIADKEKELLRSTEVNLQRNCQILRSESIASQKVIQNVIGVKRDIQSTFKKQDLAILQEFNKRDAQTNQAIQFAGHEKGKLKDQQAKNPLKALDLEALDEDVDRLIGDIQSLKLTATNSPA